MSDPHLALAHRSVPMDIWLKAGAALCHCEDVCDCGWDDFEEDDETPTSSL
jgi:hypothetical protein